MRPILLGLSLLAGFSAASLTAAPLLPGDLRCEYLEDPLTVETAAPRLSWQLTSEAPGQRQTAYQILVASTAARLAADTGDLWDSGRVSSDQTLQVAYAGPPLVSRQTCHWKVRVWDRDGQVSPWSPGAVWHMGLLRSEDWVANWITYQDPSPPPAGQDQLELPPARHYRRPFVAGRKVRRATLYGTALGLVEWHLNGRRVGDAFFEPGWSDYLRRIYYRAHDVTPLLHEGANCLGAIVADGWYAGYVGYGRLVGYGPNRSGRSFYGKTPALFAQLEIEYDDGSREVVATDRIWQVTDRGPIREADLIMGEAYDARAEMPGWDRADFTADGWQPVVTAEENGSTRAMSYDNCGGREVELGFQRPAQMQAYAAPPIRVTAELPAQAITEPESGRYVFDLGQNFAGIIRLRVQAPAGTRIQLRYGERLHPDGRLMTENLRSARATDFYTCRGDAGGEVWVPRFTYHGFQYVELTGLPQPPPLSAVTGLVLHNDTPLVGEFACSDEVLTRFWKNTQWTQRANFVELPTDCPQRDERLGWMGDAQAYIRAASYNADVAAFFTKWLDDVEESQRDFGAYPDYAPYPMGHGRSWKTFGTAWTDAGIICPWTVWQVYGDTHVVDRHWKSMTRFMDWRVASMTPEGLGVSIGNPWGDWLNVDDPTPIEYVDTCYHALSCRMMAEMAGATGRAVEAAEYRRRFEFIRQAFNRTYITNNATLTVPSQTAHVLALWVGLAGPELAPRLADRLADLIRQNEVRMTTGFLGTKPLLPVLTAHGHHDLAVELFQSRRFPSWGYEVVNGANSVWERWDSYTQEHGFNGLAGNQNASMNSFSHYAFGAVTEWMFRDLAGIDTEGPGFQHVVLRPAPPAPRPGADVEPIDWVRANYRSPRGLIRVAWRRTGEEFAYEVTLPPNTTGTLHLPAAGADSVQVNGQALGEAAGVRLASALEARVILNLESGSYRVESRMR